MCLYFTAIKAKSTWIGYNSTFQNELTRSLHVLRSLSWSFNILMQVIEIRLLKYSISLFMVYSLHNKGWISLREPIMLINRCERVGCFWRVEGKRLVMRFNFFFKDLRLYQLIILNVSHYWMLTYVVSGLLL
jgi:hypothetical protein